MARKGGELIVEILSAKALNIDQQRVYHLQLHILFNHEVIRSPPHLSLAVTDPVFDYSCSFSLSDSLTMSMQSLLHFESPVLIYLTTSTDIREEKNCCGVSGVRSLIAAAVLDFRYALLHSQEYMSVELLPCELDGVHMGVGAGVLYARLKLVNLPIDLDYSHLSQQEIEDSIFSYQSKIADENRLLYHMARNWWTKATETYPHIKNRVFKIIAEDELGYHRSVCSLLAPIQPNRMMINPRFSSRFVSLIPFRRDVGLTGGRVETWRSAHAVMSRLQGDVEDHAILLCSMLMGWGLDAWVALGTIVSMSSQSKQGDQETSREFVHRPYCWVITFDSSHATESAISSNEPKVIFWEAVSGKQYDIPPPSQVVTTQYKPHVFGELHALFRHDSYLINIQPNCRVNGGYETVFGESSESSRRNCMSFDLSNERTFLSFPRHAISPVLTHPGAGIRLNMSSIYPITPSESEFQQSFPSSIISEPRRIAFCKTQLVQNNECLYELELYLEEKISDFIATIRLSRQMQTHFDNELSLILQSALTSYEWNRAIGLSFGNSDFQMAVKRKVNTGEYFKAYPTCFCHVHPDTITKILSQTSAALDVILADSRGCRFGVRTKLFLYPEGIIALWLMIAVCGENV